jgi:hypothetical protein
MTNATPSAAAMEILGRLGRCTCAPQWPDGDRKCDCPGCIYLQYQYDKDRETMLALAIDAHAASEVERAIESAAKIAETSSLAVHGTRHGLAQLIRSLSTKSPTWWRGQEKPQ